MNTLKRAAKRIFATLGYPIVNHDETPARALADHDIALLLPKIAMRDLVNGEVKVALLEPEFVYGNVSLLELLLINTLVASRKPHKLFEFGTFDGRTSLNMIANAPENAILYTLDLPKAGLANSTYTILESEAAYVNKEKSGTRFEGTRWRQRISQLYGDSATFEYSGYHGQIDVVFIDGSHHYDYVKNDTEAALKLTSDHGLLIWHDYQPFWTGVITYLDELFRSGGVFSGIRNVEGTSLAFLEVRR